MVAAPQATPSTRRPRTWHACDLAFASPARDRSPLNQQGTAASASGFAVICRSRAINSACRSQATTSQATLGTFRDVPEKQEVCSKLISKPQTFVKSLDTCHVPHHMRQLLAHTARTFFPCTGEQLLGAWKHGNDESRSRANFLDSDAWRHSREYSIIKQYAKGQRLTHQTLYQLDNRALGQGYFYGIFAA